LQYKSVLQELACMKNTIPSLQSNEPHLAPPGAGLPKIEIAIGWGLFALRCWRGNRESFTADFNVKRAEISKLVEGVKPHDASRRVLIARPIGMEDSSRNWSLWMTLDHLRIVNLGISGIIGSLGEGIVPPDVASTAAVKPSPDAGEAVVREYENSCDEVLHAAAGVENLRTSARHAHPWFGSMDAHAWYALAGSHLGIHKVQLERILTGLRAS
jgi:hypothetical protein